MTDKDVSAEIDIDGDGKPDVTLSAKIKDPRVLAIIGIIVGVIAGTKALGLW